MAGSLKDAFQKSGLAPVEKIDAKPTTSKKEWLHELPEESPAPHVPFEAPALTKPKESPRKK